MTYRILLASLISFILQVSSAQSPAEPSYLKISQKLELRGLVHARYQQFQEEARNDGFDLRRARLDFRGDVAPHIGYRLHVEFAGNPKVLDATFIYKPFEYLNINIGQSKPTFCYDNLYSPWTLLTVSRTQIDNALAFRENDLYGNQNGRDMGIWISGKLNTGIDEETRPFLDYTFGVYNGAGINVPDNNKKKDFAGSIGLSPVKDLWVFGRFHTGSGRTINNPEVSTDRMRVGGNITYKYKNWLFEAEYISAKDENDSIGLRERNGYYVTVGYTPIKDKLQVILRLDNYDPNSDAGQNNTINKYVLASSWFFTKNTRIQFEYSLAREEDEQIDNDILAIQFQAAF